MNVILNVSVGNINVTIDATSVAPDTLDDMTSRAVVLVKALCSDEDLHAAAREPVSVADDLDDE